MLDTGKCIGCQRGISLFIKEKDGTFVHLDIFATPEAGASYTCQHQEIVSKHLKKNRGKGTYLPDEELEEFYEKQAMWWYTIEDLVREVFEEVEEMGEFFNKGEKGNKMWNQSNEVIENALLEIAKEKGVVVNEDEYSDLIIFQ